MFKKSKFLLLIIIFTLVIPAFQSAKAEEKIDLSCEGCNILFLNIELLRADHLGLLNPEKQLTPNIDEFFKDSIIFEQVSSAGGQTYGSLMSTMTATEKMINQPSQNIGWIKKEVINYFPTIADILSNNNYTTLAHNAGERAGLVINTKKGFDKKYNITDLLVKEQIEKLKESIIQEKNKPSFIFFHNNSLHVPYFRPYEAGQKIPPFYFFDKKRNTNVIRFDGRLLYKTQTVEVIFNGPLEKTKDNNIMYQFMGKEQKKLDFTYDDFNSMRKVYSDQLSYIDTELADLFKLIKDNDLTKNTIIVLFSNHGDGLWDNRIQKHGVSYQSNVHVPLIIKHPKINNEIRINQPITLIDLAPTIYDMLGIKIDHQISGISLAPLINGEKYSKEYLFGSDFQMEYIRKGNWKLIIANSEIKELYNLEDDPYEKTNLYGKYQDIQQELELALSAKKIEQKKFKQEMEEYFNVSHPIIRETVAQIKILGFNILIKAKNMLVGLKEKLNIDKLFSAPYFQILMKL